MTHDLVIRGGFIVDGTGAPGRTGDVAASAGRIAEVDAVSGRGAREAAAGGLAVAPGFIDPHTHDDAQLTSDPAASCTSWHGATTIVTGNCEFTMAPRRPQRYPVWRRVLEAPVPEWRAILSEPEFRAQFRATVGRTALFNGDAAPLRVKAVGQPGLRWSLVGGQPIIRDGRLPEPGEVSAAGRVIRAA